MSSSVFRDSKDYAKKLLDSFSNKATDLDLRADFLSAVQVVYGSSIDIIVDHSKRMSFHCTACRKEMNSVKGLNDHCYSGNHLKTIQKVETDEKLVILSSYEREKLAKKYSKDSLKYKILVSKLEVLGLGHLEEYCLSSRDPFYYKCNLCGARGHLEVMFTHVTSSSHNNRYVESRIDKVTSTLSLEEMAILRRRLFEKEGLDMSLFVTIEDRDVFPFLWEGEIKNSHIHQNRIKQEKYKEREKESSRRKKREQSPCLFSELTETPKIKTEGVKTEPGERSPTLMDIDMDMDISPPPPPPPPTFSEEDIPPPPTFKNVSPPKTKIVHAKDKRSAQTENKAVQALSKGGFEDELIKLNFIVKTASSRRAMARCVQDERYCLKLSFALANLLYLANKNLIYVMKTSKENKGRKNESAFNEIGEQNKILSSMMGKKRELQHYYDKYYGKFKP